MRLVMCSLVRCSKAGWFGRECELLGVERARCGLWHAPNPGISWQNHPRLQQTSQYPAPVALASAAQPPIVGQPPDRRPTHAPLVTTWAVRRHLSPSWNIEIKS